MTEPKTQCTACGAEILVATTRKAGGRCLPCARGTRAEIEAGRNRAQRDKAFRASAVWKFWERLVGTDFTALHPAEQLYFAVNELRGSVLNGGFQSYLWDFGRHLAVAEEGLAAMSAGQSLQLLRAAKRLVWGDDDFDEAQMETKLRAALDDPAIDLKLTELSRRFYEEADTLWDTLQAFGLRQGFFSEAWH